MVWGLEFGAQVGGDGRVGLAGVWVGFGDLGMLGPNAMAGMLGIRAAALTA